MSLVSGPGLGRASSLKLHVDKHVHYIASLDKRTNEYEYWLTEHLRLGGVYWGLTALHILRRPDALPRDALVAVTLSCWHPDSGGFGPAPGHHPHMLYTCYAVQILAMADALDVLDLHHEPLAHSAEASKRSKIGKCKLLKSVPDLSSYRQS